MSVEGEDAGSAQAPSLEQSGMAQVQSALVRAQNALEGLNLLQLVNIRYRIKAKRTGMICATRRDIIWISFD